MLGFNYVFKLVEDGKHGRLNVETGEFDGMIRELLDGVYFVAISYFTIILAQFIINKVRLVCRKQI